MKIGLVPTKKGRFVFLFIFILSITVLFFLFLFALAQIKPVFEAKASHSARVKATEIINTAINDVFFNKNYEEFVKLSETDGKITSVSAKTSEMNKLKSELAISIAEYTENSEKATVYIPVGSLTGYPVLQGIGFRIPVKISFDGVSKIDFDSEFVNSGINQVKHKIFLRATAEYSVISSAMSLSETVYTEIPVSETVIVGEVPEYYGDKLSVVGR